MATITASYSYASGDLLTVMIDIENDYPDAMSEATKTLGAAMREALVVVAELEDEDGE